MNVMRSLCPRRKSFLVPLAAILFAAIAVSMSATATVQSAPPQTQSSSQAGTAHLVSVTATGSVRFRSEQIAPATGLKIGDTVTREDLQRAADRLAQLGPFAKVGYRFSSIETGVKAEYQVTDSPGVPVTFDNFPWLTDDELVAELKSTVFLFDGTAPEHGAILDEMSSALEKLLARRGVLVNVKYGIAAAPPDSHDVVQFNVDGAGLNVKSVIFLDALAKNDPGIKDRLPDLFNKPFSRSVIELFEVEQIRPVYFSHGFLRVQFPPSIAHLAANSTSRDPNPVDVLAPIIPGIAYTWGGVTWVGSTPVAPVDLDKLVLLRPGEIADGITIQGIWEKVRVAYGKLGFLDLVLDPTSRFDDAEKRVTYTCLLSPGTQYHMGKLVLTGLSLEGERRIRAAWKIPPGSVFNETAYEEFLDIGVRAAFSGFPAHYEKIGRFPQKDPKTATVDVLLDFQ
jgi:outer membrane protein assembly factor BamA